MTNSNSPDLRGLRRFLPFDDFATKVPDFNTGQRIARNGLVLKSRSNAFSRTLPRILLLLLSCGFLMCSVSALTCHGNCQTCYGQLSTECMSCKATFILQSNACIPSTTGCSTGYLLTVADQICRPWVCSANCETCWDVGASQCMSCKPNFILQDFTCIAKVGAVQPFGCSTDYQLDLNDQVCKKTIYDIDNPCNPGTVNLVEGASSVQQCLSCGAGFYCESFANAIGGSDCNAGHFCQSDSNTRSPAKEYDSVRTLAGGTLFASPAASATNYFIGYDLVTIPNGSQNDVCQPGYYSSAKQRRCTSCSGTKYCPVEWMKDETTSGPCRAGFYCVTACTKPTPNNPLPLFSTIFTTISTTPLNVSTNSGNAIENLESTLSMGVWTSTAGGICPTGSYCAAGVSAPKQCDIGYFLPYQGATAQTQCLLCPAGLYCPSAGFTDPYDTITKFQSIQSTYFCAAGYVCLGGAAVSFATPCLQDYKCVTGTRTMVPCQPNEYTIGMRSSTCITCPDGNFCVGQAAEIACGSNQFCKDSIISYCKPGRNSNTPLGSTEAQFCRPCPKGQYCQQPNINSPCSDGFYCISDATGSGAAVTAGYGSLTPRPNFPVSVTNNALGQNGGICVPGYFCKASVSGGDKMIDCTAGQYCSNFGLSDTVETCREGYICVLKATSPIGLFDGVDLQLSICPPGSFCPGGSSFAQPCPAGTYSQSLGAAQSSDCKPCPAGAVCTQSGVAVWPAPTAAVTYCPGGNYCPAGADQTSLTTSKYLCDRGYRCPAGDTIDPLEINAGQKQILCEAGTYQNQTGQSVCLTCPVGQYCDYEDPTQTKQCPAGFFCSGGTKVGNQQPCPSGYYSNEPGKTIGTDCKLCDLGYYCFLTGQQSPTAKIVARYHGNGQTGQVKPNPYLCPVAAYCPDGTGESISCADGQWTSDIGMATVSQCIPCKRGKFCKFATMRTDAASSARWIAFKTLYPSYTLSDLQTGFSAGAVLLSTYYGDCQSGYICKEGSKTPTPLNEQTDNGYKCPAGYFCQPGFVVEKPCEPGFYNPSLAQGSCIVCPAGQYCASFAMTAGKQCIAGHYCPAGSIYPNPCPAGTYVPKIGGVDQLGLVSSAVCTPCDVSNYCENIGDTQVTGLCAPGFVCGTGMDRPGPYATTHNPLIASSNGKCPSKAYCEQGTTLGKACGDGFYQDGVQQSECFPSPPGKYCVAGVCALCDFGYYCQGGGKIKNPGAASAINDSTGGICPIQNYCYQGAGDPRPCDAGTWQSLTNQFACTTCEKGYLCQGNGIKIPCPAFNYCDGDLGYPFGKLCPGGFYGSKIKTGFYEVKNCTACPATTFCQGGRQSGQCAAGYVCKSESDSPTPTNLDLKRLGKAYPCPAGDWCPQGTQEPNPCPLGYFTREAGGRQEADCSICPIGYYCDNLYPTPQNCPPGYYCPIGSYEAIACPKGSYNPTLNAGSLTDCLPCAAGYTCPEKALGNIGQQKGKYRCPLGHYCPEGYDNDPIPCIDGSFFDDVTYSTQGQGFSDTYVATSSIASSVTDCKLCPENFYCPQGTGNRYSNPCRSGYICPPGSGAPLLCPPGFYCQNVRGTILKKICPVGYFCPIGTETPHRCQPGTVCIEGSSSEAVRGMTPADCKPGEYLNVDKCFKCEPGFVCDSLTSQKYPIYSKTEGGYECPVGSYCPAGTGTSTIKPCPPGTFRLEKIGKSLEDCLPCPNGSVTSSPGSKVCTLCGRGATNNADRTNCECIGAFRTWLAANNQCVCQTGYFDPIPTQADQTSAINLDCKPVVAPFCLLTEFVDEFNQCKAKSSCKDKSLCNGQGDKLGDFDSNTNNCYCKGATNEPSAYCDSNCQKSVLKAYYNNNEQIILQAGSVSKTFTFDDFADSIFLDGLYCPKTKCEIVSTQQSNGSQMASGEADQVFVDAWRKYVDPKYISPYASGKKRALYANHTTEMYENHRSVRDALRNLQAATFIEKSIQCINQYDAISFSVSQTHFPVYVKDSSFNSEQNYDFSSFDKLKNKLLLSQLNIKSFMVTFKDKGVFAIGDYATPNIVQTLIFVTDDVAGKCSNQKQWPLTVENINKLGIKVDVQKLVHFDKFLHVLPILAVAAAFFILYAQNFIEKRIEMKELEMRTKRENMVKLKAYFKKKEDRFDKMGYLSDMYKLMQEHIDKINQLIAENERLVKEQDEENIRKKLKIKHSIYDKLEKDGKLKQIEKLRADVNDMLDNLRTPDGRTLRELYNQQQLKKKLLEEEARLRAMHEKKKQDMLEESSEEEESFSLEDESENDSAKDELKDSFQESEEDKKESDDDEFKLEGFAKMDPIQQDDWRRIKEEIQKKKKDFEASLDPHLSDDEKATMMRIFNDQMKDLERDLRNEKQNQDQLLQKKLMDRKKRAKKAQRETEIRERDKTDKVTEAQEQINELQIKRDSLEEHGIKTKDFKREREEEFDRKMKEFDVERDKQTKDMREDYLDRIRNTKDGREKERLLEEMGRRMKQVEDLRIEERLRQEASLKKMLKDRQKKNVKKQLKAIDNQIEFIEKDIDKIQQEVDEDKAKAYAEEGATGLIENDVKERKDKILDKVGMNFAGFMNQLNEQEKEDIKIQKARLQMELEKEIRGAEAQIDDQIDQEALYKLNKLQEVQKEIRGKIKGSMDPLEQRKLLEDLEEVQRDIDFELKTEKRNHDMLLDAKRKKRAQLLQIKKMQIESDQLKEINNKEIELNQKKFDDQMGRMDDAVNAELEKQCRTMMNHEGPNKEQALILIHEVEDDLLAKKLKILMSKQFFDLTKYLGTLQSQAGLEHMMRVREIKMAFEKDKQDLVDEGINGDKFDFEVNKLRAQMETEMLISAEKMKRDQIEKESELRQVKEKDFAQEKKDLQNIAADRKRAKIKDAMDRFPEDKNVQEVGMKLLKRINNTLTDEIADLEKEREINLEKARLKIIADDQEALADLQKKMNEDMEKAENELENKMKERKQNILSLKKQNLDDRIKMAQGELTDFQIKELRAQFTREYEQLEQVISNEKEKQLRAMRAAMLERRINKERKRKQELVVKRQEEMRNQNENMSSNLAAALKNKLKFSMGIENNQQEVVQQNDQLLAKLHAWEKGCQEIREERGGEEGNIWNLQYTKEKEDAERARVAAQKAEEKKKREEQVEYTVRELLKRIARVEKVSLRLAQDERHAAISNIVNRNTNVTKSSQ